MRYKTVVDSPLVLKAKLDPTETAPALGKGQAVVVTKWGVEGSPEPMLVKTCPDGQVPDFVVGNAALSASSPGDIVWSGISGSPALLGGIVSKGDPLVVSGGKFVKGTKAGDKSPFVAGLNGAANDVIPTAPDFSIV